MPNLNDQVYGFGPRLESANYNPTGGLVALTAGAGYTAMQSGLSKTITVPPSGVIVALLTGLCQLKGTWTSGALDGMWALDDGAGTVLSSAVVSSINSAVSPPIGVVSRLPLYITAQTPGTSLTLRWVHAYSTSSGASIASPSWKTFAGQDSTYSVPISSPALMELAPG